MEENPKVEQTNKFEKKVADLMNRTGCTHESAISLIVEQAAPGADPFCHGCAGFGFMYAPVPEGDPMRGRFIVCTECGSSKMQSKLILEDQGISENKTFDNF